MKIGLLKVRSFYVRSNGIGLKTLGLLKLGLLGGHHRIHSIVKIVNEIRVDYKIMKQNNYS
jgi:hypothetical protein